MTLRRLGVLVRGLPPDAAVWAEIAEAQARTERDRKVSKLEDRQQRYKGKGGAA